MTGVDTPKDPFQTMVQQSFLSLYQLPHAELQAANVNQSYDFVFEFDDGWVYLLAQEQSIQTDSPQVVRSVVEKARNSLAQQLIDRHAQYCLEQDADNNNLENKTDSDPTVDDTHTTGNDKPIYVIALTSLTWLHQQKSYIVDHQFGSQFFADQSGLENANHCQIVQLFSLANFVTLLERVATPSDLLAFLKFHRSMVLSKQPFDDEKSLLTHFLLSPLFYQRALTVQKQLIDIGLLDQLEPRLINASEANTSDTGESSQQLIEHLTKHTAMWHKLVNGLSKRRYRSGETLPVEQVRMLIGESMYTRTCIMEEVMSYTQASAVERAQGFVRHQHSYNTFGRHYMLVFYGQDVHSEFSAEAVRYYHQELLTELNQALQSPVMDDLFLLGFDFSHRDAKGQTEVRLEVFHQKGSILTD